MHTTEKLAVALEEAKLHEMVKAAREGFYHDFLSPLAAPCMQLEADLRSQHTDAAVTVGLSPRFGCDERRTTYLRCVHGR